MVFLETKNGDVHAQNTKSPACSSSMCWEKIEWRVARKRGDWCRPAAGKAIQDTRAFSVGIREACMPATKILRGQAEELPPDEWNRIESIGGYSKKNQKGERDRHWVLVLGPGAIQNCTTWRNIHVLDDMEWNDGGCLHFPRRRVSEARHDTTLTAISVCLYGCVRSFVRSCVCVRACVCVCVRARDEIPCCRQSPKAKGNRLRTIGCCF
mmetsp:Transcript_20805/g.57790  ORF Transcript_20805/g.57790 Transcript_20805/m.57790 type:complete len:210 (+) Transcript_20805:498-1127(+)